MKKIKYILIILLIIIIICLAFYLQRQTKDSPLLQNLSNEELVNNDFGNNQIQEAITNYLLTEKQFSWKNRQDSHNFCTIENLKPDQDLFPLYIWAYCGEYIIENNELKTISGSSGPIKIDYPNELSYYDLNKFSYEAPRDGSYYSEDIKKIFPQDVQEKIFKYKINNLITKAENFAFTNISTWNKIKQAIDNCEVKSIWQTHSLTVEVELKDNTILKAKEPQIDAIFNIVDKNKCGDIIMATE